MLVSQRHVIVCIRRHACTLYSGAAVRKHLGPFDLLQGLSGHLVSRALSPNFVAWQFPLSRPLRLLLSPIYSFTTVVAFDNILTMACINGEFAFFIESPACVPRTLNT